MRLLRLPYPGSPENKKCCPFWSSCCLCLVHDCKSASWAVHSVNPALSSHGLLLSATTACRPRLKFSASEQIGKQPTSVQTSAMFLPLLTSTQGGSTATQNGALCPLDLVVDRYEGPHEKDTHYLLDMQWSLAYVIYFKMPTKPLLGGVHFRNKRMFPPDDGRTYCGLGVSRAPTFIKTLRRTPCWS